MSSLSTQNATSTDGPNTTDAPASVLVGANQPLIEDSQRGKDTVKDSTAITAADDGVAQVSIPPSVPHPNISPDNLTESQFFTATIKWSGADAMFHLLKEIELAELLDDEISESFPAGNFLQTQGYMKFGLQFKVEVNCNRNAYGKVGIFYMPPGTDAFYEKHHNRRICGYAINGLLGNDFTLQVNLNSAPSGSMTVPYMNILNCLAMPFTKEQNWNHFCNNPGKLYVVVLNELFPNPDVAGMDFASAQIFLTGSLVKPWTAPTRRVGPIYQAPSLEFEFKKPFPMERPRQQGLFDTLGSLAGEMIGGPAGAAVGGALGGAVDAVATAGEHSTTFQGTTSSGQTLNQFVRGDTRDVNIMAPKPEDLEFLDNSYPEANEHIVTDVREIAKRASRIDVFTVEDTATSGTRVYGLELNYIFGQIYKDGVRLLEAAPLTYIAMMYQYCQGSIELVFEQVGSRFTSSRMIACYNPTMDAGPTTNMNAAMGNSSVRMVFSDSNSAFKIKVPYFNNLSWFEVPRVALDAAVNPQSNWGYIDVFTYGSQRGLAAETEAQPMQFNVYVMAGDDWDVAAPMLRAIAVAPPYHYAEWPQPGPDDEDEEEVPRQQSDPAGEVFAGSVTVPDTFYSDAQPVTRSTIKGRHTDLAELCSVNTHVNDIEIAAGKQLTYTLPVADYTYTRYLTGQADPPYRYTRCLQPSFYNAITQLFYIKRGGHFVGFFANGTLNHATYPRETLRIRTTDFNMLTTREAILNSGDDASPGMLWESTTLQHNFSLQPNCAVVTPQLNATPWLISKIGRSEIEYNKYDGQFIAQQQAINLSSKAQKFAMYQGAGPDFAVSFYLGPPPLLHRERAEWYIQGTGGKEEPDEKPVQQAGGDESPPSPQDFHKKTAPSGVVIHVGFPLDDLGMYPVHITCPLNQNGSSKALERPCRQVCANGNKFLNHLFFNHRHRLKDEPFTVNCLACDEDIPFEQLRSHDCWLFTKYFCKPCHQEMDVHSAWRHYTYTHQDIGQSIIDKADDRVVTFRGGYQKWAPKEERDNTEDLERRLAALNVEPEIVRQQSGGHEAPPSAPPPSPEPFNPWATIEDDERWLQLHSEESVGDTQFDSCETETETEFSSPPAPLEPLVEVYNVGSDRSVDFSESEPQQQGPVHSLFGLGEESESDNDRTRNVTSRNEREEDIDTVDQESSSNEEPGSMGAWQLARSFLGDTIKTAREVRKMTKEARQTGRDLKKKAINLADRFNTTRVGKFLGISPSFILRWLDRLAYGPTLPRVCFQIFIDLLDDIPIPDDILGRLNSLFQPNQDRTRQNSLLSDLFAVGLPSLFAVACAAFGKSHPFCKFLGVMTLADALRSSTGAAVFARALGSLIDYFFPTKTPLQEYVASNMEDFAELVNLEIQMKEERNSINMADVRIIARLRKIKPFLQQCLLLYHRSKTPTKKEEDKLAKLCEYALGRFRYFSERALTQSFPSPVVSYLVGGTGIGKTYLTQNALPAYLTALEEEAESDFQHKIFNWIPDQHSRIDGYANESIMLLDDVGAISTSNGYNIFLQLASPGRKSLPASDLDDKGIPIPIEGIVLTSNSVLPRPTGATNMEAFYRRIFGGGNAYVVAIREDVAKPDGTLDPAKAKGKHPDEVWAFQRFHWRGGEEKPTLTDTVVTFTEYVRKYYKDLQDNRATAVDSAQQIVDLDPKIKKFSRPIIAQYMQQRLDSDLNGARDGAARDRHRNRDLRRNGQRVRQQANFDLSDKDQISKISEPGSVEDHVERLFNNSKFVKNILGQEDYQRDKEEFGMEMWRRRAQANAIKLSERRVPGAYIPAIKRDDLDKFLIPHRDWKVPHSLRYTPTFYCPVYWEKYNFKKLTKGDGNGAPFGIRNHPMWSYLVWRYKHDMKTNIVFCHFNELPQVPEDYQPHHLRWIDFFIPNDFSGFGIPIEERTLLNTVVVPLILYAFATYVKYRIAERCVSFMAPWIQTLLAPFLEQKRAEEEAEPPVAPTVVNVKHVNPIPKPKKTRVDDSKVTPDHFMSKGDMPDQEAKYASTVARTARPKMPVVNIQQQSGGIDVNACKPIFVNMVLLCDIQKGTVVQKGLGLKGSFISTNLHYFKDLKSGDPMLIYRMNRKTLAWCEYRIPFLKERLHRRKLEKGFGDACFYELGEQVPYFRDVKKSFMTKKEFEQVRTKAITRLMMMKENNFGAFVHEVVGSPQFTFMTSYDKDNEIGSQEYAGTVMAPGLAGMCGSPYVANYNGRPVIVGIHTAGTSSTSFFLPLFQEEIEDFFNQTFIRCEEDYEATLQQSDMTQVEFHPEVAEFMKQSHTEVIERVPHYAKNKNDFTKTCMAPAIQELGLLNGYGPAPQTERDRRIDPDKKKHFYCSVIFKGEYPQRDNGIFMDRMWLDCVNDMETYYIPKIVPGSREDPMLGWDEVINGTDQPHSKGLDMQTSPGPGFLGPGKLHYFARDSETEPYHIKCDENGDYLRTEVRRRFALYSKGIKPTAARYKYSTKPEIVRESKITDGKPRTFCAPDLATAFIMKMVTGVFTDAFLDPANSGMEKNDSATGMGLPQLWQQISHFVRKSGLAYTTDYGSYDETIYVYAIDFYARFIIDWYHYWFGDKLTHAQIATIYTIIPSGIISKCEFRGYVFNQFFAHKSGFPNGHTLIFNWYVNGLNDSYVYGKATGRRIASFHDDVKTCIMGDDKIDILMDENLRDVYNAQVLQKVLADEVKMKITAADKVSAVEPFDPIDQLDFMSHFLRCLGYTTDYSPALKKTSIYKLLAYVRRNSNLSKAEQIESNIRDAVMASAGWGESFYDEICGFVNEHRYELAAHQVKVHLESYESILAKYYDIRT